jgi:hypothetical protein
MQNVSFSISKLISHVYVLFHCVQNHHKYQSYLWTISWNWNNFVSSVHRTATTTADRSPRLATDQPCTLFSSRYCASTSNTNWRWLQSQCREWFEEKLHGFRSAIQSKNGPSSKYSGPIYIWLGFVHIWTLLSKSLQPGSFWCFKWNTEFCKRVNIIFLKNILKV